MASTLRLTETRRSEVGRGEEVSGKGKKKEEERRGGRGTCVETLRMEGTRRAPWTERNGSVQCGCKVQSEARPAGARL